MERVINLRRQEEEILINKAVEVNQGQQTISSLGVGTEITTAQEFSLDELERLREAFKLKM